MPRSIATDPARDGREAADRVLAGETLARDSARALLEDARRDPWPLIEAAGRVRRRLRDRRVHLCGITAVKVGGCGEDCRWCAQSRHWSTGIEPRGVPPPETLVRAAEEAAAAGARHFGLVSSGARLAPAELEAVCDAARAIRRRTGLALCGSFGALTEDRAAALREAGFERYNHNVETSERHFPSVCTTHTWADRVRTARAVAEAGLELCSGALFGTGETDADRVDVARILRDLGARVVPLNFLHPIPGTPLADHPPLAPMEALAIIAVFRLMLPQAIIKVAGGREHILRDLQPLMFAAGADACLVGHYLTTRGRDAARDLAMIRDLGLEPEPPPRTGDGPEASDA